MQQTISYSLGSETVLDVWTRDAHSTPVGCFNFLPRYPMIELINWNQTSATVQGCVYHITAQFIGNQFVPADIWYPHTNNTGTVAISVHTFDSTIGVEESDDLGISVTAFPNPATDELQLSVQSLQSGTLAIHVYDVLGNLVQTQTVNNTTPGITNATMPTKDWSSGMYCCQVALGDFKQEIKLVKK